MQNQSDMTPNLPPVLPGHLPPPPEGTQYGGQLKDYDGPISGHCYDNDEKRWSRYLEWGGMKNHDAEESAFWHIAIPIARANGICGEEPTFEGIKYGDAIPAEPSADHRVSDWSVIQTYLLNLKEGERVVECGVCATTGHKGTVKLKTYGLVVEWDEINGGVMTTSLTGGTRRISDVIQLAPAPCESESPKPEEIRFADMKELVKEHEPTPPKPEGEKLYGDYFPSNEREKLESDLAAARATITSLRAALEASKKAIRELAHTGTERIRELGGECDDAEKTAEITIRRAGIEAALEGRGGSDA